MSYSLIHLLLLIAATLGVWLVRSRLALVIIGLMLFPLPAALFNLFMAPVPPIASTITSPSTPSSNCVSDPQKSKQGEAAKADCASSPPSSRKLMVSVVLLGNYLTVFIGFLTGMLCRRAIAAPKVRKSTPETKGPA